LHRGALRKDVGHYVTEPEIPPSLRSSQKPESQAVLEEEEEQVPLHTKPNNNTKVPHRLAILRHRESSMLFLKIDEHFVKIFQYFQTKLIIVLRPQSAYFY
jgi:hypothetical protein